jgi:3-hydroxyisobutyrate dehydrogenase-like beta-hydroxyacid dehydrogenase
MKKTVGVIGLGIMGGAISANLVKAGFRVQGFDVLKEKRAALQKAGGFPVSSVKEMDAPIILTSLPHPDILKKVCASLKGKPIVVEVSTFPIEDKVAAKEILAKKGITLLDCPLSGTGAQAKTGDLVVFGSGDANAFQKALPVLKGFSRAQHHLGEFGNGSRMKFVANLLVAIHNISTAEAFVLGMKAGLKPATIMKVIGDSAATSRMFQIRGPMMVEGRYDEATMKCEVWQKDMHIIGDFAAKLGVATPLFSASAPIYNAAMAQGFGKQDTAAVCAVLEGLAQVRRARKSAR